MDHIRILGGDPQHPSSVIEVRARSIPCPLCAGALRIEHHAAHTVHGRSLRVLDVTCVRCGIARQLWFRILPASPN